MKMKFKYPLIILMVLLPGVLCAPGAAEPVNVDTDVKSVVIYPQGVSLMQLMGTPSSGYEFYTVVNSTPFSDSIKVRGEGLNVYETTVEPVGGGVMEPARASGIIDSFLESKTGNRLRFTYQGRMVEGTVEGLRGGWLLLSELNDSSVNESVPYLMLRYTSITDFLFDNSPISFFTGTSMLSPTSMLSSAYSAYSSYPYQTRGAKHKISWRSSTDNNAKPVTVSYLAEGLFWKPFYRLELSDDEAYLEYMAQVKNELSEDLRDVEIRMLAGKIRIEGIGGSGRSYMTATQTNAFAGESLGASSLPSTSISSVGEYEIYNLNRSVSIKRAQVKNFPLFSGFVPYNQTYVWDARGGTNQYRYDSWESDIGKSVQVIYLIKNEGRTWSHGTALIYKEGILIGSDTIEWTPRGRDAKVTVGMAPDIEVKKKHTTKKTTGRYRYDHTVTLWLRNYKTERVTVKILDEFSQNAENIEASIAYTEKPGNIMHWEIDMNPGEEKTITYTFVTT